MVARISVRVNIHRQEMQRLLRSPTGPVGRRVNAVAGSTVQIARAIAPKHTGRLARDIHAEFDPLHPRGYLARIGNSPSIYWAKFQHQGTRAHGPRRARVMVFRPKGSNDLVFAKWVRGVEPDPYLIKALRRASPWPVRVFTRRRR